MISVVYQLDELGRALAERAVDVHCINGHEIVARWFRASDDCDLVLFFDSENLLIRFQFNVCGQIVDWDEKLGIKTGLIVETEHSGSTATRDRNALTSEVICFDPELSLSSVSVAERVLLAASEIKGPWREKMVRILTAADRGSTRGNSREVRSPFWNRMKSWMLG